MTIRYFNDLIQGSEEWHAARIGLLTASEVKLILTPTLKIANNEHTRAHVYEILAQRISQYVEPTFIGDDMLRGHDDEIYAKQAYAEHIAPVTETGFITNDKWGFTLGYSPDFLIGANGQAEVKSRRQKYQIQTIVEHVATGGASIPADYVLQVQTGLLVSEREWCDFISYCGGLRMVVIRVYPIPEIQAAILNAADDFEAKIAEKRRAYETAMASDAILIPTERREILEMF